MASDFNVIQENEVKGNQSSGVVLTADCQVPVSLVPSICQHRRPSCRQYGEQQLPKRIGYGHAKSSFP